FSAPSREWLESRFDQAVTTAADVPADMAARVRAIELAGSFPADAARPQLLALLSSESAEAVQIAVTRALADDADPSLGDRLLELWADLTPEAKRAALETMLSREDLSIRFLTAAI